MSCTFEGQTVYYLYEGHEEIGSYDSELKNLDLKVLSSGEGSISIAIELDNQNYSPLLSSQGHIVGLVETDTGKLADRSYLTMFGEDLVCKPLSPWRFCGKRHEASELGLIDFGFRFYHSKSAQWLTQDPIGETDGPNLYAYVGNSPTCCIDRFGLIADGPSFQKTWTEMKNGWGQANDFMIDNTINSTRFHGAARAIGGLTECAAGASLATGGTAASGGLLAPVAVPAGCLMMAHGGDNFIAGCNQFITGRKHDPLTVKLLEKTGMSNEAASIANDALCFGSTAASTRVILNSGTKIGTSLSSFIESEIPLARTIDPNLVRFSQSSISNKFKDGKLIDDLANSLMSGAVKANKIPPIRLVNRNKMMFTLDNRRLKAFQRAGIEIPYRMATPKEIAAELRKFSSTNDGRSIHIRGKQR